jgi:hypothetical protein
LRKTKHYMLTTLEKCTKHYKTMYNTIPFWSIYPRYSLPTMDTMVTSKEISSSYAWIIRLFHK